MEDVNKIVSLIALYLEIDRSEQFNISWELEQKIVNLIKEL